MVVLVGEGVALLLRTTTTKPSSDDFCVCVKKKGGEHGSCKRASDKTPRRLHHGRTDGIIRLGVPCAISALLVVCGSKEDKWVQKVSCRKEGIIIHPGGFFFAPASRGGGFRQLPPPTHTHKTKRQRDTNLNILVWCKHKIWLRLYESLVATPQKAIPPCALGYSELPLPTTPN